MPFSTNLIQRPANEQRCDEIWNTVNQRQGLSTNAKACYDKLGEKVVALLWFDECAQSASLRLFFFLFTWSGIQSTTLSRSLFFCLNKRVLQSDSHHLNSLCFPLPMPLYQCLHQRFSVFYKEIKRKMYTYFKKKIKAKPKSWKIEKKLSIWWWNQVSMNESKQAVAPHNSHIWCSVHKLEKKKKKMTDNEWGAAQFKVLPRALLCQNQQ